MALPSDNAFTTPTRAPVVARMSQWLDPILDRSPSQRASSSTGAPPTTQTSVSRRAQHSSVATRIRASSSALQNHHISTPMAKHSTRDNTMGQTLQEIGNSLMENLGEFTVVSDDYIDDQFLYPSHEAMNEWLHSRGCEVYNSASARKARNIEGSWVIDTPKAELDLYTTMVDIINAVLVEFVGAECDLFGVEREALDYSMKHLHHEEGHRTSPDIIVRATGPSFQVPPKGRKAGYSNMATFIDVKLDTKIGRPENKQQMSVYAREVFAQQPNRMFVRGLLLSEKRVQLFHFDHGGSQMTELINIHGDPETLIRLLVGLCRAEEPYIGLDTSIHWEIDERGRKKKGTLTTTDVEGNEKTYDLTQVNPVARSIGIRGRSTTCWGVKDRTTGERFLIKESWSSEGRVEEYVHFETLKQAGVTVEGLCEMVSYESSRAETGAWRSDEFQCFNRKASRLVLKAYGNQIQSFKNILQFLYALRAAIKAHKNLYSQDFIHRDISNKNILLGIQGAAEGEKGILIDLGMAINVKDTTSKVAKEARTGTRFFQSCMILQHLTGLSPGPAPAHDYLDDLESFFNVFCFSAFQQDKDGKPRADNDRAWMVVQGWDDEDPTIALATKSMLFHPYLQQRRIAAELIGESWGKECRTLFEEFVGWVMKIQREKAELLNDPPQGSGGRESRQRFASRSGAKGVFASLFTENKSNEHYDEVIGFFDKAINTYIVAHPAPKEVEPQPRARPKPKPKPQPQPQPRVGGSAPKPMRRSKRRLEDKANVEESNAKQLCNQSSMARRSKP